MHINPASETDLERVERALARGFVVAGGVFWMGIALAGPYAFPGSAAEGPGGSAVWPLLATAVALAVGWTHERLAAELLLAATAAVVVWGVLYSWTSAVWLIMGFVLVGPMALSAVLFLLAARAQERSADAAEGSARTDGA